ncbi:MAG: SDR family oxidoreductase [Anaerolineaceae bacterium]|nr:SDR family oxidoreductase [Anaerolineaceae bacterium]
MVKRKILIPGVSGLLGLNLALACAETDEVVGTVNSHPLKEVPFRTMKYDFSSLNNLEDLFEDVKPDLVVNCVAIANLDASERQPVLARKLNAELPGKLAEITKKLSIPFVHISTDAVFDGQKGNYTEDDEPRPVNIYGATKLAGEKAVSVSNPDAIIARVNFYGWSLSGKRSLCEFFYNYLKAGSPLKGFSDLFYSPMMVSDLVETLLEMVEKNLTGIYHVSTDEALSKYDFGCRLAEVFGFDVGLIEPASWCDIDLAAVRSPDLTMDVSKLTGDLGHGIPCVLDGLIRLKAQQDNGYAAYLQSLTD